MKTSEIFREVHKLLGSPQGDNYIFICITAAVVGNCFDCPVSADRAKETVMQRIAPHYSLNSWVRANVRGVSRKITALDSSVMREFRLRWLDALIAEFEAKGD